MGTCFCTLPRTLCCLSCEAGVQCRGRGQECREWADHTVCALVSRRVLDLFLGLEGRGQGEEKTIATMEESCGTQTWETSSHSGRNVDLDQDAHSERAAEYLLLQRGRKKGCLCPVTRPEKDHMRESGWFTVFSLNSFYDFCNLADAGISLGGSHSQRLSPFERLEVS